ncbi:peptidoglycan-binding protein [Bradyrhizobium sp. WYCCWR 13023]|uniref:Peptidoglycan-binding protein n=1 Tax=Bradyrhizobium zhengyangense TaxID=2911009 RepID=A0A9X1U9N0_9BRAD|nr:peptidoglycan-binding protein [Bradyrhizobium zhengyangense]MCG2628906.1 peptidoglycan-binding protein [Bradyrhizobium zhengyangense]MCG2638815.1 peptidoglycan-binding protein [Bradyrhizobium zhengyangense]MCG2670044.1 peptidoglycan-binding protein [Bradyrhizobium zhengyangense]
MVSYESLKSGYESNWANLQIRPARLAEAKATARKAISGKATYQQVERLTGVPWCFVALCHYRESNFDFDTYLGNGESLHRVTSLVPKGRGPFASFVEGAVDALRIQNFVGAQDWCIARTLYRLECFNGLGYHAKGVNSPYLYGGSTLYGQPEARAGKFVADHVFDPNHIDSQLGTAVILHAMMSQDSSINFDDSPSIAPHSEPDEDETSSVLLMQQTLNRLGAKPPLVEDGISGPKTKAAVSLFQQQNGLQDTGLLDGTTIAAVTRAGIQPVQMPTVDLSQILSRLESLGQLLQGGGATKGGTTSGNVISGGTTVANDPIGLLERLLALANNAVPTTGPTTPGAPAPAPADQLKPIVDLLSTLLNKDGKPVLGQVNGALGETIGKMLDGKKTALGIGGSLITALLSAVTASPNAGGLAGLLGTIASAVPGLSQFALPISLALTAWGVLGKMEKWAQGTAPPPKVTT